MKNRSNSCPPIQKELLNVSTSDFLNKERQRGKSLQDKSNDASLDSTSSSNEEKAEEPQKKESSSNIKNVFDGIVSKLMDQNKAGGANPLMNQNPMASINPLQQMQQQQQAMGMLYSMLINSPYQSVAANNQQGGMNPAFVQNPYALQAFQQQVLANSLLQSQQRSSSEQGLGSQPAQKSCHPFAAALPMLNAMKNRAEIPQAPQAMGISSYTPTSSYLRNDSKLLAPFQKQQQAQNKVHAGQQQPGEVIRRPRTRISDEQLKILRENFDITTVPGEEQIQSMAHQTNLPIKVIKHWFRNTLFKERQRSKDSPYNFNIPPKLTLDDAYNNKKKSQPEKTNEQAVKAQESDKKYSLDLTKDVKAINFSNKLPEPESNSSKLKDTLRSTSNTSPKINPGFNLDISQNGEDSNLDLSSFLNENNNMSFDGNLSLSASQRRPARTKFSDFQLNFLKNLFRQNPYPKDEDLDSLSKSLNLSQRVIVVWFQNARQKARRQLEQQQSSSQFLMNLQQSKPESAENKLSNPSSSSLTFVAPLENKDEQINSFVKNLSSNDAASENNDAASNLASNASKNENERNNSDYQKRLLLMFEHLTRLGSMKQNNVDSNGSTGISSKNNHMEKVNEGINRGAEHSQKGSFQLPMISSHQKQSSQQLKRTYAMSAMNQIPSAAYGNQTVLPTQDYNFSKGK